MQPVRTLVQPSPTWLFWSSLNSHSLGPESSSGLHTPHRAGDEGRLLAVCERGPLGSQLLAEHRPPQMSPELQLATSLASGPFALQELRGPHRCGVLRRSLTAAWNVDGGVTRVALQPSDVVALCYAAWTANTHTAAGYVRSISVNQEKQRNPSYLCSVMCGGAQTPGEGT